MVRPPKLYPDLWWPRLGYIAADTAILLWIAFWLHIGNVVYNAVMTLSIIAYGVIATGQKVNDAVQQIQQAVNNLPAIGSGLRDALNPLHNIPQGLIAQGHS